jgi:hypothetical protein
MSVEMYQSNFHVLALLVYLCLSSGESSLFHYFVLSIVWYFLFPHGLEGTIIRVKTYSLQITRHIWEK